MNFQTSRLRNRERGQTVIIALIVLGVLMIVGFVFIGFINRNIQTQQRIQNRSESNDLAEAGIRYAHDMLVKSELGADWRGEPVVLPDITRDPDVLYIRPRTHLLMPGTGAPQEDLGGPDGLGPFVRVPFANGRALVRVRWAFSDAALFSNAPEGPLRTPGAARRYLVIESIGREGQLNPNDPTTLGENPEVRVRGFATEGEFHPVLARMRTNDAVHVSSRRLIAFASIGIIESARFITDKYRTGRPADLGAPRELGAEYNGVPVLPEVQFGSAFPMWTFGSNPIRTTDRIEGMGSVHSNAPLTIHGTVSLNLNTFLGDKLTVADGIRGADDSSTLRVNLRSIDRTTGLWNPLQTLNVSNPNLDSRRPEFNTLGGAVVDGVEATDSAGFSRGVGYKTPPSAFERDPSTGNTRYEMLTRESGAQTVNGNNGQFGFGQGIYVDNSADRQIGEDEESRARVGTQESLVYDWLNPNNGQTNSAWQGPFYVPRGAYVQLDLNGISVIRDPRGPANERTWKNADGSDTGQSVRRYWFNFDVARNEWRVTNNHRVNPNDWANAAPFNGVMYFEGNVRVRGTIPGGLPLTLVSRGSIYIEGSITRPWSVAQTGSGLGLIAREYVVVNTPMFFGPTPNTSLEEVQDGPTTTGFSPVRMRVPSGQMAFQTEFILGSTNNSFDQTTFEPMVLNYRSASSPGVPMDTVLMLSHTMDDGPAPTSTFSLNINPALNLVDSSYYFPRVGNSVGGLFAGTGNVPVYGLGTESWQRYGKFETSAFTLVRPSTAGPVGGDRFNANTPGGNYAIGIERPSELLFRPNIIGGAAANDYLLARVAVVPHDIRIEAMIYAEEGSFFVIPGPWFNPNPNDTRVNYAGLGATEDERIAARREAFGAGVETPFYGEPIDVRVQVLGAVSENMPPPISQQAEWIRKWGWIPREIGATGLAIPVQHFPTGYSPATAAYVPNLSIAYDPVLATGQPNGFSVQAANSGTAYLRHDIHDRPLPPLPRLPVSPVLTYFGDVN